MKKMVEIHKKIVLLVVIIITSVYVVQADTSFSKSFTQSINSFFGTNGNLLTGMASTSRETNVSATVGNANPVVTAIDGPGGNSISPQSITEDGITDLEVTFTVTDTNGVTDINLATVNLTLIMQNGIEGVSSMTNTSCGNPSNVSASEMNISCSVEIQYWYNATEWNLTAGSSDFNGGSAENTTNFTLQETTGIVIGPASISFTGLTLGAENNTATDDPIVINNTGNDNIDSGNIQVTGLDLVGEVIATQAIDTGNFSIGPETGGSPPSECSATTLVNNTATGISGTLMYAGNRSISESGKEDIYACLTIVPSGISAQTYSTVNSSVGWTISVV